MIDEAAVASLMTASLNLNNAVYGLIRCEGHGEYAHLLDSSPAICSESLDLHLDAGKWGRRGGSMASTCWPFSAVEDSTPFATVGDTSQKWPSRQARWRVDLPCQY